MAQEFTIRMVAASGHTFGVDDIAVGAASELGYFQKFNVTPSWIGRPGGVAAVEALLNREADVAYAGFGPVMRSRAVGAPVKLFVSMALGLGQSLVVQDRIKTTDDLRGVTWAVDGINAMSHHFALLVLRALEIPREAVTFIVAGSPPSRIEALVKGEVDCSLIRLEEAVNVSRDHASLRTLLDFDELLKLVPLQPHGVLVTREDYLAGHVDALVAATEGLIAAARAIHHDREVFVAAMNKCAHTPVERTVLDRLWQGLHDAGGFAVNGGMSISRWREQLNLYAELYPEIEGKFTLTELLAPEITARALAHIGVDDAPFDHAPGQSLA